MVATRYSLAKTRSKKSKFAFGNQWDPSTSPVSKEGSYRKISNNSSPQLSNRKPNSPQQSNKKLKSPNGINTGKKSKVSPSDISTRDNNLKRKSATKLVMPCKLGNKVNCIVHKKNTRKATEVRAGKSPKTNQTAGLNKDLKAKVTRKTAVAKKSNSKSNESNVDIPDTLSEKLEKIKSPVSMLLQKENPSKTSPSSKLSPVTFKKNIRQFLEQAIKKRLTSNISENNGQETHVSTEVDATTSGWESPRGDKESDENRLNLRDRPHSNSHSKVLSPNSNQSPSKTISLTSSVENSPMSTRSKTEVISITSGWESPRSDRENDVRILNLRGRPKSHSKVLSPNSNQSPSKTVSLSSSVENSPMSTRSEFEVISSKVSSNSETKSSKHEGVVPNLDLRVKNKSTNNQHSSLLKSKSLEMLPIAELKSKEYNTRRSCFYSDNILTRNLVRNSKYFKNLVFKKKVPNNDLILSPRKIIISPKQKNPSTPVVSPVSTPKSTPNLLAKTRQTMTKKIQKTPEDKSPSRQTRSKSPLSEDTNAKMKKRMLKLMTKKFGSNVNQVNTKSNENNINKQKELDKELVEIVDELAAVDNYVQEKILSFKRNDKKYAFIIQKSAPNTGNNTAEPNNGKDKSVLLIDRTLKKKASMSSEASIQKINQDYDYASSGSRKVKMSHQQLTPSTQKPVGTISNETSKTTSNELVAGKNVSIKASDRNANPKGLVGDINAKPVNQVAFKILPVGKINQKYCGSTSEKTKIDPSFAASPQKKVATITKETFVPFTRSVVNGAQELKNKDKNAHINKIVRDISPKTSVETSKTSVSPANTNTTSVPVNEKQKTLTAESILKTLEHIQNEDNNDSSTNSILSQSSASKSYVRTKLPLTLKTKIVVSNGKKIKKKLSKKESRIYNLLRCYGGSSVQSPEKVLSETSVAEKEKLREKPNSSLEAIQLQDTHQKRAHNQKSSEETEETENSVSNKESKTSNKEKHSENEKNATPPVQDSKHKNKEKIKVVVNTPKKKDKLDEKKKESPVKSSKTIKNGRLDSEDVNSSRNSLECKTPDKDKRQKHKAKYNIIKDINSTKADSKKKKEILGPRKEKGENNEDSEEDWTEEDDDENATFKDKSRDLKTYQYKMEQKAQTKKIAFKSNDVRKTKGKDGPETQTIRGGRSKTRPLSYNTSDSDSSDDNREDLNENNTAEVEINDESDNDTSSVNNFLQKLTNQKKTTNKKSLSASDLPKAKEISKKQGIQSNNERSSKEFDDKQSKTDKQLGSKNSPSNVAKSPGKRNDLPVRSVQQKTITNSDVSCDKNKLLTKNANRVLNGADVEGNALSDADIFDDSTDARPTQKTSDKNSSNLSDERVSTDISPPNSKAASEKLVHTKEKLQHTNEKFQKIVSEHVNKYKTKDLVENLMMWTDPELKPFGYSVGRNKERDLGNYRDYTTRTGISPNPVRILKRKACQDLKKKMNNEYKNGHNGKDYFQCICFNKFFITRVKNKDTGNLDILNVKVKPNKSENVTSIHDVEFCTFCSRLYDKYKDNFIIINQEYIMNEFIQRHTKDWNRLNKSYDNDVRDVSTSNISNPCNYSFASTATTTKSHESKTNSWTESRLESISSDKNDSIRTHSDYSDYYLNEMFMRQAKERFANSHEFQRYKQKCRNVNLKINEICDLYQASPTQQYKPSPRRISSTETKSYVTDEGQDEGVFTRPNTYAPWQSLSFSEASKRPKVHDLSEKDLSHHNMSFSEARNRSHSSDVRDRSYSHLILTSTPCKSQSCGQRIPGYNIERVNDRYMDDPYACTPRKSQNYNQESDSMEENHACTPKHLTPREQQAFTPKHSTLNEHQALCTPKHLTPNSFTCSRTPTSHSSRKDLYRHKIEKTKDSFERLFNKVWRKCSPAKYSRKRLRLDEDNDDDLDSYRQRKKQRYNNSSSDSLTRKQRKRLLVKQMNQSSSDVMDEYDADLSDSDANRNNSFSKDIDVVYKKQRRHYVNKLFIKQSSKRLVNRKTSYSDSEQVIKIQNVKKKVYTTIHRKVYKDHEPLRMSRNLDDKTYAQTDKRKNQTRSSSYLDRMDDIEEETMGNCERSSLNDRSVQSEKTGAKNDSLKDKITEIQYETLWSKLAANDSHKRRNEIEELQQRNETDLSDCAIVTGDEREVTNKHIKNSPVKYVAHIKDKAPGDPTATESTSRVSPDTTNKDLNAEHFTLQINNKTYRTKVIKNDDATSHLMNEILVKKMDHSTSRQNKYEHIKEKINTYAKAVNSNIEPINKTYVLKLIKSLMKCKEIKFDDYRNALDALKINVNLNEKNEFLIKVRNQFSKQDEPIMRACFDKLRERYQRFQSEVSASTFSKFSQDVENKNETITEFVKDESRSNRVEERTDADLIEPFESFKANLDSGNSKNIGLNIRCYTRKNDKELPNSASCRKNANQLSSIKISKNGSNTGFALEIGTSDLCLPEELDIEIPIGESAVSDLNATIKSELNTPPEITKGELTARDSEVVKEDDLEDAEVVIEHS